MYFAEDLESQVQDLQEANESASGRLVTMETALSEAREENLLLRRNQDGATLDLKEENALLKEQVREKTNICSIIRNS